MITFNKIHKLIIVGNPATEVSIQDLINAIRDYEDELMNLDIPSIANATGKQDLGGDLKVGITLELLNNWKVKFEDRGTPTTCSVKGGNLVGAGGVYPIEPATNVTVLITQSSSATISDIDEIKAKKDTIKWADIFLIKKIENGRWKIDTNTNEMIFYDANNQPMLTFDLKDKNGNPAHTNVYERVPK